MSVLLIHQKDPDPKVVTESIGLNPNVLTAFIPLLMSCACLNFCTFPVPVRSRPEFNRIARSSIKARSSMHTLETKYLSISNLLDCNQKCCTQIFFWLEFEKQRKLLISGCKFAFLLARFLCNIRHPYLVAPSSPVHNRRLLSAKNIRMSSVELPDDNDKSPSSASTSPCPSPVGGKVVLRCRPILLQLIFIFLRNRTDCYQQICTSSCTTSSPDIRTSWTLRPATRLRL